MGTKGSVVDACEFLDIFQRRYYTPLDREDGSRCLYLRSHDIFRHHRLLWCTEGNMSLLAKTRNVNRQSCLYATVLAMNTWSGPPAILPLRRRSKIGGRRN